MRQSYILRAFAIALLLLIAIVDSLSGFYIKLAFALIAATSLGLSFYMGAGDNKQNHDAESILVVVFFISLVGLFLVFSSSPTHIIVEPDAINETFTFPNDIDGSNKTISIKNLGSNAVVLNISADGNNIKDNGAIFISLSSHLQIERERTEYVSVKIDPSLATTNGEYKGAIIIETDDKKLRKEVPISIKIKGITSSSAEPKAKENKSVTFKSVTLNLTGSLAS